MTSLTFYRRQIDVETTSCVYWDEESEKWLIAPTIYIERTYVKAIKFVQFLWNFVPAERFKTTESRNHIPRKLNIYRVWDSLFLIIWRKFDIDTRVSHIYTSNEISLCLISIN